jgi:predicted permease
MLDTFLQTSATTFVSMLKIFLVMLTAGLLVRKRVLTPDHIKGLTAATVDVFLPCMTFYSIMTNLKPGEFGLWWVPPVAAGVMALCGFGLAALFFARELPAKRNMLPLIGIHNAAYLPLPLGALLYPDRFDLFSLYVFLFLTGQTPIIWSVGKYMTTAAPDVRFRWKDILNPPMVSALFALALVFTGLRDTMMPPGQSPGDSIAGSVFDVFLATIRLLGEATIPVALFILGGVLGNIRIRLKGIGWDVLRVIIVKFLLVPLLTLLIVIMAGLHQSHPLLATFFIIEGASAPGVVIILQVSRYGGDEQKLGSMLLVTYLVCLVALPFWLALWSGLCGQ